MQLKIRLSINIMLIFVMISLYYIGSFAFYEVGYTFFYDFVLQNPVVTDAIFCGIMAIIYGALFILLKQYNYLNLNDKSSFIKQFKVSVLGLIIILGISFFIDAWLSFLYSLTQSNVGVISESVSNTFQNYSDLWDNFVSESYLWTFLSIVLFGPIMEEILFRGIIQNLLMPFFKKPIIPLFLTSLLFAIWHGNFIQFSYTIWLGLAIAIAYYATNSLTVAIIMHMFNNFLSELPPYLNNNVTQLRIFYLSVVCAIPAIIILYRLYKNGKQWNGD